MYGVMIVDDEPWVLDGLTNLIDWDHYNMEIVASMEDGEDAIRFFQGSDRIPDIVLTDIRMPGKSGLELLEEILDVKPNVRGVILSGYRDFEYARRAIRCGVFEYLVKPVGKNALLNTMMSLIADLESKSVDRGAAEGEAGSGMPAPGAPQRHHGHPGIGSTPDSANADAAGNGGTGGRPLLISRALERVEARLTDDLGLSNIAADLEINASYLSAHFSERMGETFKHYVSRRKVEKAKEIWRRNPSLRVYELCLRVGYQDVNHFSRLFKKIEGVTPREYKARPAAQEDGDAGR